MMQLTKEQIDEYKQIYFKYFGKEISDAQALEQGTKLVRLVKLLLEPIKNDNKTTNN